MAIILVDYENVKDLKGVELLNPNDTFILFYSGTCKNVSREFIDYIYESQCHFRTVKLKNTGKNALDFYIAAECGILAERGAKEIGILSADSGYNAVIDFFSAEPSINNVKIFKAKTLEKLLLGFTGKTDICRKDIIKTRNLVCNLDEQTQIIKKHNKATDRLKSFLINTELESKLCEIVNFLTECTAHSKKELYIASLHYFGRRDGIEIYNFLKDKIPFNE